MAATNAALDGVTATVEHDRVEAARARVEAERHRIEAARLEDSTRVRLAEAIDERGALAVQRQQLDDALTTAETLRAEAIETHHHAREISDTMLAAAEARAELLESELEERLTEVELVLEAFQRLVLDRPRPLADEHTVLQEVLRTAFREITAYRDAELAAANRQADALIAWAHQAAAQMTVGGPGLPQPVLAAAEVRAPAEEMAPVAAADDHHVIDLRSGSSSAEQSELRSAINPFDDRADASSSGSTGPSRVVNDADLAETIDAALSRPSGRDADVGVSLLGDALAVHDAEPRGVPRGVDEERWLSEVVVRNAPPDPASIAAVLDEVHDFPTLPPPPAQPAPVVSQSVTIDLGATDGATLTIGDSADAADGDVAGRGSPGRIRSFFRSIF